MNNKFNPIIVYLSLIPWRTRRAWKDRHLIIESTLLNIEIKWITWKIRRIMRKAGIKL